MTTPVKREEILDNETYEAERPRVRKRAMDEKARRRVHLGDHLTFLFENRATVRYQVQEMLRIEKRTSEADVLHELATYNELLGPPGGLGCSLLVEIDDAGARDEFLAQALALPENLELLLEDGRRVRAKFDERQVGEDRLSAVQYLQFDCGGSAPVALACSLPGHELEVALTPVQQRALASDLEEGLLED